jgi:glyoxylase-like metal-dependent hydrolase (beta-lactamase superfamily II)/rhodanese-related sulfurtransferase
MYFKQILDERCGCASYLIASRQTGEAAIIDPSIETEQYEPLLQERGFTLRYVIDTHIHADHVSGARKLAAQHGADLCLHESAKVQYAFRPLSNGEELQLGQLKLKILHTPGHRPELISVLVINPPRSPEPSMVLTGDSLLVGDVGRPDFGGGDPNAQFESISKLLRLPDWVAVFPGHFEGPCGKGMCGRPSTTIGFERLYSPLLHMDHDPFVSELTNGIPARPLNMVAIEATNRGLTDMPWAMLTTSANVDEVGIEAIDSAPPNAYLLDVREPEEFSRGHVAQAINIPQAELASRLNEIPRDRPVLTICQSGKRSHRSAQFLHQQGIQQVATVVGGTSAWRDEGRPLEVSENVTGPLRIMDSEWAHAGAITVNTTETRVPTSR